MTIGFVLGLPANLAGVHDQQVRLALVGHRLEAFLRQQAQHDLTVVEVHLAAQRFDKDFARLAHGHGHSLGTGHPVILPEKRRRSIMGLQDAGRLDLQVLVH